MTADKYISEEKSSTVLQAFLDLFTYPVWISDENGSTLLNTAAKDLISNGFKINRGAELKDNSICSHKGKKFTFRKQAMNHGTDFCLYELKDVDESVMRIKASSDRLSAVLDKYSKI